MAESAERNRVASSNGTRTPSTPGPSPQPVVPDESTDQGAEHPAFTAHYNAELAVEALIDLVKAAGLIERKSTVDDVPYFRRWLTSWRNAHFEFDKSYHVVRQQIPAAARLCRGDTAVALRDRKAASALKLLTILLSDVSVRLNRLLSITQPLPPDYGTLDANNREPIFAYLKSLPTRTEFDEVLAGAEHEADVMMQAPTPKQSSRLADKVSQTGRNEKWPGLRQMTIDNPGLPDKDIRSKYRMTHGSDVAQTDGPSLDDVAHARKYGKRKGKNRT